MARRAVQRCDACGATEPPPLEPAVVEGVPVVMCADPVMCRMRAQKRGMWKQ